MLPAAGIVPQQTLTVLDTITNTTNTQIRDSDRGLIDGVEKEPVVIGCGQNLPFTGFIDEVRH